MSGQKHFTGKGVIERYYNVSFQGRHILEIILCKFKKFKFSRGGGWGDHPPPPEHTCYQVEIGFDRNL